MTMREGSEHIGVSVCQLWSSGAGESGGWDEIRHEKWRRVWVGLRGV